MEFFGKGSLLILHCLKLYYNYKHSLPTFVLDQHALQGISSCKLAHPQFPVHLLPWYDQGSTETLLSCTQTLTFKVNVLTSSICLS